MEAKRTRIAVLTDEWPDKTREFISDQKLVNPDQETLINEQSVHNLILRKPDKVLFLLAVGDQAWDWCNTERSIQARAMKTLRDAKIEFELWLLIKTPVAKRTFRNQQAVDKFVAQNMDGLKGTPVNLWRIL